MYKPRMYPGFWLERVDGRPSRRRSSTTATLKEISRRRVKLHALEPFCQPGRQTERLTFISGIVRPTSHKCAGSWQKRSRNVTSRWCNRAFPHAANAALWTCILHMPHRRDFQHQLGPGNPLTAKTDLRSRCYGFRWLCGCVCLMQCVCETASKRHLLPNSATSAWQCVHST
jgi:hypothetical protein